MNKIGYIRPWCEVGGIASGCLFEPGNPCVSYSNYERWLFERIRRILRILFMISALVVRLCRMTIDHDNQGLAGAMRGGTWSCDHGMIGICNSAYPVCPSTVRMWVLNIRWMKFNQVRGLADQCVTWQKSLISVCPSTYGRMEFLSNATPDGWLSKTGI